MIGFIYSAIAGAAMSIQGVMNTRLSDNGKTESCCYQKSHSCTGNTNNTATGHGTADGAACHRAADNRTGANDNRWKYR